MGKYVILFYIRKPHQLVTNVLICQCGKGVTICLKCIFLLIFIFLFN